MKTDELITIITQDARAPRPSLRVRTATALAVGGLVAMMLFTKLLDLRPDIAGALQTWRFDTKLAIVLMSFATALWITARLTRMCPSSSWTPSGYRPPRRAICSGESSEPSW